jgi:hypothetical protein
MLAHADWKEDMILEYIRHKTPCPKKYFMNGYPIVNSMVIRQLLGRQWFIYTRSIGIEDLEKAKIIVDKYDAFVPISNGIIGAFQCTGTTKQDYTAICARPTKA